MEESNENGGDFYIIISWNEKMCGTAILLNWGWKLQGIENVCTYLITAMNHNAEK
jgi:nitrogen fixation protein